MNRGNDVESPHAISLMALQGGCQHMRGDGLSVRAPGSFD